MNRLYGYLTFLYLGLASFAVGVEEIAIMRSELPDIDFGANAIRLLTGEIASLHAVEAVRGTREAKDSDYMYYDDADGAGVLVSSGLSRLIKHENCSKLWNSSLTDLVQEKEILMGIRTGDFVLAQNT